MADTMLPCPFCGGEARESKYLDESLWSHELVTWYSVSCPACDYQMTQCKDHDELVKYWNRRHVKADTITIPRDLFERLCEAAVQVESQSRWMDGEYGKPFQQEYDEHLRTMNEALAIRDGGIESCQHKQS